MTEQASPDRASILELENRIMHNLNSANLGHYWEIGPETALSIVDVSYGIGTTNDFRKSGGREWFKEIAEDIRSYIDMRKNYASGQ